MAVAKAALECSVRYLAFELGEFNIRVNAISAGPLNTLAARGVSGFTTFRGHVENASPLRRNIEQRWGGSLLVLAGLSRRIIQVCCYFLKRFELPAFCRRLPLLVG
jgi:enoyl-[acyl-carrier protein] reductase I